MPAMSERLPQTCDLMWNLSIHSSLSSMRLSFLAVALLFFLTSGCDYFPQSPPAVVLTVTATPPTQLFQSSTAFSAPTSTHSPIPSQMVTPESSRSALATEQIGVPDFTQCAILHGYTFDELPQITSRGFNAPRPGHDDGHHGIDLAHYQHKDRLTIAGVPVQSILAGRVAAAISDSWPYGNMIIVETPAYNWPRIGFDFQPYSGLSLYHLYAHLQEPPEFINGDEVSCGQVLGAVGNSGWSGNFHLHFESRSGPPGVIFPAMRYYQTSASLAERLNYERWRFGGEFIPFDPYELLGK